MIGKKHIVVIGSGLAGTLICNELIKHAYVTLLEIGHEKVIKYPDIEFVNKEFGVVKTLCHGGGGTTNLWHNGLIPINSDDITSEEFSEVIAEAKVYIDKAAYALNFKNGKYSSEYKNALNEVKNIFKKVIDIADGLDCLIYPKRYKKLKVSPLVRAKYAVSDIDFILHDKKIDSINYQIDTNEYSVKPDIVIICAGALASPFLVQKIMTEMNNPYKNTGSYFMDHPMGFIGKVKFKKGISEYIRKISFLDRGDYIFRTAVKVKSKCGKYTGCIYFRPAFTMSNNLSIYKYKSLLGASKGLKRLKNALSLKILHPDILTEIVCHLFGINISSRTYNILFIGEQKRGKNRVYYDGDQLKVDWSVTEEELQIYREMIRNISDMLYSVAVEINIKLDITEEWLWSAAHHSGTIPIGSGPEEPVDNDLKLKNCDNVYVCDGSIIQEHSYANTGLAIGQLAIGLAERVQNRL